MTVDRVSLQQSGEYKCTAVNKYGSFIVQAKIEVQIPPKIKVIRSKISVEIDQTVTIPCFVSGLPEPKITWSKDSQTIENFDRHFIDARNSLTIQSAILEDGGIYICHAENQAGEDFQKIILNVLMRPIFFKKQWPLVAPVEGENVVLECQARGVPKPMVSWYLDDNLIYSDDKFQGNHIIKKH